MQTINLSKQLSKPFFLAALPLFLAIFIDGMGLGLLFPILNTLLVDPQSGFFTHQVNLSLRHLLFGITMSIFMACWFFGAAYLGDLSDAIGRKKSLMACLLGSSLGYLISGIGVLAHSITLLILGRVIAGFTGGSQSIAQAAIIDISEPELRARNIGYILLSASLGFIAGPLCGALLSDHRIVSWFNLITPFYFATMIALFNAILLQALFTESFTAKNTVHLRFHRAIEIFISAFRHEKVRHLSIVLFLMILGWSSYYGFISMYLAGKYNFNTTTVGLFMAVMAGGFGFGFGWLVNYLSQRYALKQTTMICLLVAGILTAITAAATRPWLAWAVVTAIGMTVAVAYSMLITLFSSQVDENSQGWVMGITGAIMAAAFAITGITSALLANWNINLPIWFAGIFVFLSGAIMLRLKVTP